MYYGDPYIFQARIQDWIFISYSGDIPDSGIEPASPALAAGSFTNCTTWEALYKLKATIKKGMADIFHMKISQTIQRWLGLNKARKPLQPGLYIGFIVTR